MSGFAPSTRDLGLFFDAPHVALGERLVELLPRFEALEAANGSAGDAGARAREAVRVLAGAALFELLVPPAGASAASTSSIDLRGLCLVRELLGYTSPLADSIFAVQGLGSYPVLLAGTDEQRARFLPAIARGEHVSAFALTEPDAGSDVGSLRTRAEERGDSFVLDGDKAFISNAGLATHYVVFARTSDGGPASRALSAFLVEAETPGLAIEPIAMSIDHPIGRLRLRGCAVPRRALVGEPGRGLALALATLDTFRPSVGAAAAGMARRALDETIARVLSRVQFGKALAEQQQVQAYVAEMATELDAARLLVYRAAHARDRGKARIPVEAAMAKLFATEAAQRVIDRAVQLHGGLGVTRESKVEALYREIRPLRIYEGTTEIQRLIIARALLADGGAA